MLSCRDGYRDVYPLKQYIQFVLHGSLDLKLHLQTNMMGYISAAAIALFFLCYKISVTAHGNLLLHGEMDQGEVLDWRLHQQCSGGAELLPERALLTGNPTPLTSLLRFVINAADLRENAACGRCDFGTGSRL